MSSRIEWLDVSKGIVIILMVLGHAGLPDFFRNVIFAFHMPFFFIASGLTTKFDGISLGSFCWKKIRSLGIPFVVYSVMNLLLWPIVERRTALDYIKDWAMIGWGGVALWFVPVLLFSLIISRGIYAINDKRGFYFMMLSLLLISSSLSFFKVRLPWQLSVVPYASFFVLVGDLLKHSLDELSSLTKPKWFWYLLAFLVLLIIPQIWRLDMAWNDILPVLPKTLAAICGCFLIAKLSVFIVEKMAHTSWVLKAVGRETFIILSFSQIIIASLNRFLAFSAMAKYSLLILALTLICLIKRKVVQLLRNTVL